MNSSKGWMPLVCVGLLCTSAAGGEPYESPAAVYSAMQKCVRESNREALAECLTPDSMEVYASFSVILSFTAKEQLRKGKVESTATPQSINAVLKAHNLTEERVHGAFLLLKETPAKERNKVFLALLSDVPHKPRFIVAMYRELQKMNDEKLDTVDPLVFFQPMSVEFVDLKVDGDSAIALVTPAANGKKPRNVHFRKTPKGWLIHFPVDFTK